MSVIITFMFEPAKLQMNWASASGAINLRAEASGCPEATASLTGTGFRSASLSADGSQATAAFPAAPARAFHD
jgi:hypothetical protein